MPSNNSNPQGRYWIATIPADKWAPPIQLPAGIQWLKGQKEEGPGGFIHWQLVFSVPEKARRNKLKSDFFFCPEAHLELTRSAAANEYVHKAETAIPDTQFEFGLVQNLIKEI